MFKSKLKVYSCHLQYFVINFYHTNFALCINKAGFSLAQWLVL